MYIAGLVIPVPEEKIDAYRRWAEYSASLFQEYGCVEIVESWEDDVPDGKQTDFRRAVAALPGEKIVFVWQIWPDKATLSAAEAVKQTIEHLTAGRVRGNPLADLGHAVDKAKGDQAVGNTIGRRSPTSFAEPGVPPRYGIAGPGYLP